MRELFVVAIVIAIALPIAGLINAEKWAIDEMSERFRNAQREGIAEEMRLQDERILHATAD